MNTVPLFNNKTDTMNITEISNLARLITDARRKRGITQSELAQQVGCKQSAVSMLERGHESALAWPKVEAILKHLGIDIPKVTENASMPVTHSSTERPRLRYCPIYDCPSNIPFTVQQVLLIKPNPSVQPATGDKHCTYCGELLEQQCPECGSAVNNGACCAQCGTPYISIPPQNAADNPTAWADAQRTRLNALGLLA